MTSHKEHLENHNNTLSDYIQTRKQFCQHIDNMVSSGEYSNASELVWNAIIQSIKALATVSEIPIHNHGIFQNYLHQILEKVNDNEYHQLFLYLENLHRDFHNTEIDAIDFPIYLEKANTFLEITDHMIERKQ